MTKDNLFELIQSLSSSEKRYFTVNGGREDSNHMRLFQMMRGMTEFDKKKLKKAFPKNFSWEKGNLYKLILKNMRNYRSDKSAYAEIKGAILDTQFLLERGLYEQALKRVRKGKETAEKFLRHGDLSELNQLERKILFVIKPETLQEDIHELITQQQEILQTSQEEMQAFNAYHFSALDFLKQMSLSKELQKGFTERTEIVLTGLSPRVQYNYLLIKKFNAQLLREFESVFQYTKKITDWWEDNPNIKEEEKYQYIADSFNYLASCIMLKKFDEVLAILIKMEEEETRTILEERVLFESLVLYKHLYYINIGDFTKAKKEYFKIVEKLNNIGLDEKNKTSIFINFAILFFFTEDFRDCINVVNTMLKKHKVKNRQDIQWFGKILKAICFLELGDVDNLDNHIRSTKRSLSKGGLTDDSFELTLLLFLKKINNSIVDEKKELYAQVLELITNQKNNPNNLELLGLDEYYFWIKSRVEKIPMTTLYQATL